MWNANLVLPKQVLKKAEQCFSTYLTDFKIHHNVTEIETMCYWHKHGLIKQNREFCYAPAYKRSSDFYKGATAI